MLGLYVITGAIVVIWALAAVFDPNHDGARLAEARRELRRSGHRYPKGSEE